MGHRAFEFATCTRPLGWCRRLCLRLFGRSVTEVHREFSKHLGEGHRQWRYLEVGWYRTFGEEAFALADDKPALLALVHSGERQVAVPALEMYLYFFREPGAAEELARFLERTTDMSDTFRMGHAAGSVYLNSGDERIAAALLRSTHPLIGRMCADDVLGATPDPLACAVISTAD
jgi:hypothetical protein